MKTTFENQLALNLWELSLSELVQIFFQKFDTLINSLLWRIFFGKSVWFLMLLKTKTNGYHKKWEPPNNGCNPNLLTSSHTTIHEPTQIHDMHSTNKLQSLKFHYWAHWYLLHKMINKNKKKCPNKATNTSTIP